MKSYKNVNYSIESKMFEYKIDRCASHLLKFNQK